MVSIFFNPVTDRAEDAEALDMKQLNEAWMETLGEPRDLATPTAKYWVAVKELNGYRV